MGCYEVGSGENSRVYMGEDAGAHTCNPTFKRLRQEYHKFTASLDCIVSSSPAEMGMEILYTGWNYCTQANQVYTG